MRRTRRGPDPPLGPPQPLSGAASPVRERDKWIDIYNRKGKSDIVVTITTKGQVRVAASVVDPDPYSGASWIRIQILILKTDKDPHM